MLKVRIYRVLKFIFLLLICNFHICNAQDTRNTIIKDIKTEYKDAIISDIIEFNGNQYFLTVDKSNGDDDEYAVFKLIMLNHSTDEFVTIKEDSLNNIYVFQGINLYKTNSNFFYFSIDNYVYSFNSKKDIWYSDGTSTGTYRINSLSGFSILGCFNNSLYFYRVIDNNSLFGIYKISGNNGTPNLVASVSHLQTSANQIKIGTDNIYFVTYDTNTSNFNLNSIDSDGNINVFFSNASTIFFLGIINNKLVFYANNLSLGSGVFSTNGNSTNTVKISTTGDSFMNSVLTNNLLYYSYNGTLYSTDGTLLNTKIIQSNTFPYFIYSNLSLKNELLFYKLSTNEMWKTDGNTTVKLNGASIFLNYPISNNKYLVATRPDSSFMYFIGSNETSNSNKLSKYYYNSNNISTLDLGFKTISKIKFVGTDLLIEGELNNTTIGSQFYLFRDNVLSLYQIFNRNTKDTPIDKLGISDDLLFYTIYNQNSSSYYNNLVVSNGLSENTFEIPANTQANYKLSWGSTLYKKNSNTYYMFNFEGIAELNLLTKSYSDITTFPSNLNMKKITRVNQNILLFDEKNLYKFDTTNNTYSVLKNFGTDTYFGGVYTGITFNNFYYFSTYHSSTNSTRLWKTDGTIAGTQQVYTWNNNSNSSNSISRFYIVNNNIVLKISINNVEYFWKTDGTQAGTSSIAQIPNGLYSYDNGFSSNIFSDGQNLYVSVKDNNYNINVYRTNSTLTNLNFIQTLSNSGYLTGAGQAFCKCQNSIYFFNYSYGTVSSGSDESNLWKIDPVTLNITKIKTFVDEKYLGNPICTGKVIWIPSASYYKDVSPTNGITIYTVGFTLFGYNVLNNTTSSIKNIITKDNLGSYLDNIIYPFKGNSIIYQKYSKKYGLEMYRAGECESNNLRNGNSITGDYYFTNAIQTEETISSPNTVSLFSEKNILLLPGFEAKNGSVFYSTVKTCK